MLGQEKKKKGIGLMRNVETRLRPKSKLETLYEEFQRSVEVQRKEGRNN